MSQNILLDLSRWQWALTAAMHITFPSITVGTSLFLVVCYGMYMRTDSPVWLSMFRFWRRIFAIGFGVGVVSGIVMTFQFGLNWGRFAADVGPILGVIIAMEVVSAFFLEAGFLGLLIYGDGRISRRMMMLSTCMVSGGTVLSVTWILVANSWMQTPSGFKMVDGRYVPTNWLHVIFNPSFGIRFAHMLLAVLISGAWFICGISAYYLVKRRHLDLARRGVSVTLGVLAVLMPLQMFVGDNVADYVVKYKLPQIEAMEGNWQSKNTGYNVLVIPDSAHERNRVQISIPWVGSAIAKDWGGNTPTPGLSLTPSRLRPMMVPTFYGFRAMFFGALLMMAIAMIGVVLRLRRRLFTTRWFHRVLVVVLPIGTVAIWGGWVTAETGRQPWIVNGRLLTAAAVSPLKPAPVLVTFVLFIALYLSLLGIYVFYVARAVSQGPGSDEVHEPAGRRRSLPGVQPTPRFIPGS